MKKLAFTRLEIERMPGLPGSIQLGDLGGGIVIIAGPNASGKTTSARVMNYLLWPEVLDRDTRSGLCKPHEISIHGTIKIGDENWVSGYNFGSRILQRESNPAERLPVSPPEHRSRYNLWLARLLADTDQEFAQHILRESLGGYNLEEAAEKLIQKTSRPSRNLAEYRDLQKAENDVKELTEEHRRLKRQEEELDDLRKEKKSLDDKVNLIRFYELLIDYRHAGEELSTVENNFQDFHQAHQQYHRQIFRNINNTEQNLEDLTSDIAGLDQDIDRLEDEIGHLGLPSGGIPVGRIEKLKDLENSIREIDRLIEENQQAAIATGVSLNKVRDRIRGEIDLSAFFGFDTELVSYTAELVERESEALASRNTLQKELSVLGEEQVQKHSSEIVGKGIDLLKEWVREVAGKILAGIPPLKTGFMLILALAAVLGMFLTPYLGLLILIPFAWWIYEWVTSDHRRIKFEETSIRRRFTQTGLEPPLQWDMDAVKKSLIDLIDNYKDLQIQEERRERRRLLVSQMSQVQDQLEVIDKEKAELFEKSGFRPGEMRLTDFYYLIQHIDDYNTHEDRLDSLQVESKRLTDSRKHQVDQFNGAIQEYSEKEFEKGADIKEQVFKLEQLDRKWRELKTDLKNKKQQRQETQNRLEKENTRCEELFKQLGLNTGDRAALLKIDENHDHYLELSNRRGKLQHKKQDLEQELKKYRGSGDDILKMDIDEARQQKEACEEAKGTSEEIGNKITTIETQIKERKKHRNLESALKRREICRERLDALFEQYTQDYFLARIIDTLKQENQKRNFPGVFDRASNLLFRFTENRYSLAVQKEGNFAAIDHANKEQMYSLEELSAGTRIQLLLAVRLAFVEHTEDEVRLPFFADELLAVSDDIRAKAIMNALMGICREGRQVFYFTARGDEVQKWLNYAKAEGIEELVQLKTIGPGEIFREGRERVDADMVSLGYGRDVPAPDDQTYEEYGKALQVPAFDLMTQDVDRIHPWYLTNDTQLIYECLQNGLLTWGQIQAFLNKGMLLEGVTSDEIGKMAEAVTLIKEVLKLWRLGRPKPIDRSVLRQADAISPAFIEKAEEVAQSVDYDPVRFMEAVEDGELKRFQNNKKDELREFLEQEGYIPSEQAYTEDELNAQIKGLISNLEHLELDESWWILENILGID